MADIVSRIMDFEEGHLDHEEMLELFTDLIKTGYINHLQGSYQYMAKALIDSGEIYA